MADDGDPGDIGEVVAGPAQQFVDDPKGGDATAVFRFVTFLPSSVAPVECICLRCVGRSLESGRQDEGLAQYIFAGGCLDDVVVVVVRVVVGAVDDDDRPVMAGAWGIDRMVAPVVHAPAIHREASADGATATVVAVAAAGEEVGQGLVEVALAGEAEDVGVDPPGSAVVVEVLGVELVLIHDVQHVVDPGEAAPAVAEVGHRGAKHRRC